MREIKYRAWDKSKELLVNAELILGIRFDRRHQEPALITYTRKKMNPTMEISHLDKIYCNEFELMQYTELKTTDYKEIYDGDLLRFNDHSYDRTGGNMNDRILVGEVAFSCGMWIVKTKDGHFDLYTLLLNDDEAEVIGNIHEHPHLLEVDSNA